MKTSSIAAAVATTLLAGPVFASGQIFSDDFETGDLSKTENGFVWQSGTPNVYVSSEMAHSGRNSLCFKYAGKPSGSDSTAEQRFLLGNAYTELWVRFYVLFPENYFHRPDSPSNNKLMSLWSRDYQSPGNLTVLHLWSTSDTGNSRISYMASDKINRPLIKDGGYPAFLDRSTDLGKWVEVTFHWKRQSTLSSSDGQIQFWKKVGDGPTVQLFAADAASNTWGRDGGESPDANFLDRGYLMGWANSGFEQDTTICIDDVSFSTEAPFSVPSEPSAVAVK